MRMAGTFTPADLADFNPPVVRPVKTASVASKVIRRATAALDVRAIAARRPPNVILVVLESVAARLTSVNGGIYDSTPTLKAESSRALSRTISTRTSGEVELAGRHTLVHLPEARFPRGHLRVPGVAGTSLAAMFRAAGIARPSSRRAI